MNNVYFEEMDGFELQEVNGGSSKAVAIGAGFVGTVSGVVAFGCDCLGWQTGFRVATFISGGAYTVAGIAALIPAP